MICVLLTPFKFLTIEIIPFAQCDSSTSLNGLNLPLIASASCSLSKALTRTFANSLLLIYRSNLREPSPYPLMNPNSFKFSILNVLPSTFSNCTAAKAFVIVSIIIANANKIEHNFLDILSS